MAKVVNLFTGDTATPVDGLGNWTVSGGVASITKDNPPTNVSSMLVIVPSSSATVNISLDAFEIPEEYRGQTVDFGFYTKSEERVSVTVVAVNDADLEPSSGITGYASQTITFVPSKGAWAYPRVNRISCGTTEIPQFIQLSISFDGHNGEPFYFARPVLTPTYFHTDDDATNMILDYVPQGLVDVDLSSEGVVAGFGKLVNAAIEGYRDVYGIVGEIQNLDHIDSYNNDAEEFSSTLVSPDHVQKDRARWLAQFVGGVLVDPSAGLTPWANLPKIWAEWAAIDTDDAGTDVDWSEVESYNIELIGIEEYFRWQLSTQAYTSNGGTYNAMVAAAKKVLSDTQTVEIVGVAGDPWKIRVRTIEAETSPVLLAAAMYSSKPAGFELIINDEYLS
jgi:hypothetical protein